MNKQTLIFLIFTLWFGCAQSQPELTDNMIQLRQTLIRLAPALQDKLAFKNPKNQELIQAEIKQLQSHLKAVGSHPQIKDRGMPLTLDEIQQQFDQAEQSFRQGNKDVARWQLNSSLGLCLHCHSQAPGRYSLALSEKELKSLPENPLVKADLLFILRDFKAATNEYTKILNKTHSFDSELHRLYRSYNRLLFLAVRFDQDQTKVKDLIRGVRDDNRYPKAFKRQVAQLENFLNQQVFYKPIISKLSDDQLMTFLQEFQATTRDFSIETDLYSPGELQELWLAGELFERLQNDKPKPLRALVLHTLAKIDERSGENLFYSLSNRYLEECIRLHPKSTQAQSCFNDLNERLVFAYSGSGGTDLPSDVTAKIRELQMLARP
jgi:hypothetical protein